MPDPEVQCAILSQQHHIARTVNEWPIFPSRVLPCKPGPARGAVAHITVYVCMYACKRPCLSHHMWLVACKALQGLAPSEVLTGVCPLPSPPLPSPGRASSAMAMRSTRSRPQANSTPATLLPTPHGAPRMHAWLNPPAAPSPLPFLHRPPPRHLAAWMMHQLTVLETGPLRCRLQVWACSGAQRACLLAGSMAMAQKCWDHVLVLVACMHGERCAATPLWNRPSRAPPPSAAEKR